MIDGNWQSRQVGLRFMLGELPLGQANFQMLRFENHFTDLGHDLDDSRFELTDLPPQLQGVHIRSHPTGQKIPRIKRLPWGTRYAPHCYCHFCVDLTGSFDNYLKSRNKEELRKLRSKVRNFEKFCGGTIDMREYRKSEDAEEFFNLARKVSQKTYQERLLRAGLPEDDDYLQNMRELAGKDGMRGYLLFHNDRPIAYAYDHHEDGIMIGQFIGYDPEYAKYSPGTILQYRRLEMLFAEGGYRLLDLGTGECRYKRFFATDSSQCADLYYFRKSVKAAVLIRLHLACDVLSENVGRCLQAAGIKDKLRKLLRKKGSVNADA